MRATIWTRRCRIAKFFISSLVLFSIFVETSQQRNTKAKWDSRGLPTNSVYGKAPDSEASAGTLENSRERENSSFYETGSNDETYEQEDYLDLDEEIEDKSPPNQQVTSSTEGHVEETEEKVQRPQNDNLSSEGTFADPKISQEADYYYYYDDYDNGTSPKGESAVDSSNYFDSSEQSGTPVSSREISNGSMEVSKETGRNPESGPIDVEKIQDTDKPKESSTESPRSTEEDSITNLEKISESDSKDDLNRDDVDLDTIEKKVSLEREDEKPEISHKEILIGVVSVVTTKSVVNGTISVPTIEETTTASSSSSSSPSSSSGEQLVSPIIPSSTENPKLEESLENSDSTEDSIIVASVQTSRSISGARFLPFDVVQKKEKNSQGIEDEETSSGVITGQRVRANEKSVPESTESIIDKLDRVQSELSSGFLEKGFPNSGNDIRLDVIGEQTTSPTSTTPRKISGVNKFVPRRYGQDNRSTVKSTIAPTTPATTPQPEKQNLPEAITEKVKFRWPSSARNSNKNNNRDSNNDKLRPVATNDEVIAADLAALLPPGYKLKKEDRTTEKSLLVDILAKSKIDISSLLPANYSPPGDTAQADSVVDSDPTTVATTTKAVTEKVDDVPTTEKSVKSLQDLFAKTNIDPALLPPGYKGFSGPKADKSTTPRAKNIVASTTAPSTTTSKSSGGFKLVFPSRPGGRKAPSAKTIPHNPSNSGAGGSRPETAGSVTPKIQKGWPVRATTEFTGWPTSSTTPISIEKLLEAARTATVASTNFTMITTTQTPSTTSTSTTTTTTQRPTTPGICETDCEVAGTIRLVGESATWVPELLDRNTQEWQQLAEDIEKQMNLVFLKSSVLKKWYKSVRIDGFSPGSILVDYFIELVELPQQINTQELKVVFHDSLRTYNSEKWNETPAKGPIRLGSYSIDPQSTDFVVIPKVSYPQYMEADDRLIPQWAIAIIVIGVGGLLFIIVFGVSVLVNRQNAAKLKPGPVVYTEEVAKSIIQASHAAPSQRSSQDYPKSEVSTIWNDTDVWRDKSFESNSNEVLVDGSISRQRSRQIENIDRRLENRKYNMYDSWRSEWNGYYYDPSQTSKFAGYETTNAHPYRQPPDYDTNF